MINGINADVVIIGAGLTGLTAAYYISKAGKKVALIEKNDRCGGVINTICEDDFVFEAGPNSGVLGSSEIIALFEDLGDKCTLEIANKEAKKRLIWKKDRWLALPGDPISAINTPLFTLKDKLRILGEPFRAKGTNPDESVAELVLRRLGKSFLDYAVDPFISGIYAGDPNKIITRFALPKLYDLEQNFGSFIKGSILKKPDKLEIGMKKPTREVFSVLGGLKNLINALENSIGKDVLFLNSENISININESKFTTKLNRNGAEFLISSRKIITTAGGYALPEILNFIPASDLKPISDLEYAKVVQIALGYKNWNGIPLDAFGGLVPSVEKRKILGILYLSTLFQNRAPKNGALLSVFMGGMRNPSAVIQSDDEIISIVLSEVSEMMKLKNVEPDLIKIFRYNKAIPQYGIESELRLARIKELETKYPGLYLAGNIRDGIGMSDRVKQGRRIAEKILI